MNYQEYKKTLNTPIGITPQQLANKLHSHVHSGGYSELGVHQPWNSCPCYNLAMYYLGFTKEPGLFWPDGKGGNEWKESPPPPPSNTDPGDRPSRFKDEYINIPNHTFLGQLKEGIKNIREWWSK